jgi:succinate dehydrogenase / fumarate reductase cytochrome b subunit
LKPKRPVNLDITTISLPLTNLASFAHRMSGVGLFVGVGLLLFVLQKSLESEESFETVSEMFDNKLFSLVLWLIFAALLYHFIAGTKHLLLDFGFGETKVGAKMGAVAVVIIFFIAVLILSALLWL